MRILEAVPKEAFKECFEALQHLWSPWSVASVCRAVLICSGANISTPVTFPVLPCPVTALDTSVSSES